MNKFILDGFPGAYIANKEPQGTACVIDQAVETIPENIFERVCHTLKTNHLLNVALINKMRDLVVMVAKADNIFNDVLTDQSKFIPYCVTYEDDLLTVNYYHIETMTFDDVEYSKPELDKDGIASCLKELVELYNIRCKKTGDDNQVDLKTFCISFLVPLRDIYPEKTTD